VEGAGALHRRLVGGRFHHAQARGVALGIGADGADAAFGKGMAALAMPGVLGRLL